MSLGYETFEDNRSFEQKGLTGDVQRFTTTKMEYPCYILNSTEDNPIKMFKMQTLTRMYASSKIYDEALSNNLIHIYFSKATQTVKVGIIQPSQVKSVLTLFNGNEVFGYLDKDTLLEGDKLYVLAE